MKTILVVTIFLVAACTRFGLFTRSAQMSPDEVVRQFLKVSAGAGSNEDRKVIEGMCHGEMKRIFERMSDEMFTMSYLSKQLTLKDVEIVQSNIDKEVARIRYRVVVENRQGTDTTEEKNEREVELSRIDGQWKIDSIRALGSDQIAFSRGMVF